MPTQTNFWKYPHKINMYIVDESGEAAMINKEEIERQNRIKDVCLNCNKKKCYGTDKCFNKERNKK